MENEIKDDYFEAKKEKAEALRNFSSQSFPLSFLKIPNAVQLRRTILNDKLLFSDFLRLCNIVLYPCQAFQRFGSRRTHSGGGRICLRHNQELPALQSVQKSDLRLPQTPQIR